jgi:hypothetical protein
MWFSRSKFRKFPVIFPVSREFSRRKVSARLRPPPYSLDCREFPLDLRRNTRNMPVFRDYFQTNRTGENGPLSNEGGHCPGFSLEGTWAVRFRGGH